MKNQNFMLSNKWAVRIATLFNIGYFPFASGTVASFAVAIFFYIFRGIIMPAGNGSAFAFYMVLTGLIIFFGTMAAEIAEGVFKEKDSHKIVIDEAAGFFIGMLFLPVTIQNLFLVFIFFRIYDVIKPFGIRDVQKYKGGFGVMADDILAGLLAMISVHVINWIF